MGSGLGSLYGGMVEVLYEGVLGASYGGTFIALYDETLGAL
jgi:hypothetical protein